MDTSTFVQKKVVRLFVILSGFFVANAIIAKFIGVKKEFASSLIMPLD